MASTTLRTGDGVNLRLDHTKAAKGHAAYGVFVATTIGAKFHEGARFFRDLADAERQFAAVSRELATLREDEQQRQAIRDQMPPLPPAPKGTILFETFAQSWLKLYVTPHLSAASRRSYASLLDTHLLPIMRAWPMDEQTMTQERILDYVLTPLARQGLSLAQRRHLRACLSSAFTWACTRSEYAMKVNPAKGIGLLIPTEAERRRRPAKHEPNPMTPEQAAAYLAWFHTHARRWWEFVLFLHDTGVRVGEASALKWDRLTLAARQAWIVDAFSASERTRCLEAGEDPTRARDDGSWPGEKDTKTHRADQYIELTEDLTIALEDLQATQRAYSFKAGHRQPVHCFTTNRGTPRRPDGDLQRCHDAACDDLDLRGEKGQAFTIHNLRDTFATTHILKGTDIGWVSRNLGHADEQTTRRYYYRWMRLAEGGNVAARLVEAGTRVGTRRR
jgi:integrase